MAVHQTFTSNADLASLLGPALPNQPGDWFGSLSIWAGLINNISVNGNYVVDVGVTGIPGVPIVQAEVFGARYDSSLNIIPPGSNATVAGIYVTKIEWSLPNSATVLASYQLASPLPFAISVSSFVGIYQFVNPFLNGVTTQAYFDDMFGASDTLTGSSANETMRGGGGGDFITGNGGADILIGDQGNDTFYYRTGDAAAGESIDGGSQTDAIVSIGAAATGDLLTASSVNISNLNISSIEQLKVNGTETVVNGGQVGGFGFTEIIGLSGALDVLTIGNVNNRDFSGLVMTNWDTQDLVGIIGTSGADMITGTAKSDVFAGLTGADNLHGGQGDDRFLVTQDNPLPSGAYFGDAGTDILQLDAQAITTFGTSVKTDARNVSLSSIETLEIVKGHVVLDASVFNGTITGTVANPVVISGAINRVIGNGDGSAQNITALEITAGTAAGIDLRTAVFENWNDGFYIDKSLRLIAGAQTQAIYGAVNEENFVNGAASLTGIYIETGSQYDEVYGSNLADYIVAGGAYDYLVGRGGDDFIDAGDGDDYAWGGDNNDTIGGGAGIDHLYGDGGNDRLVGGLDKDFMEGGTGDDTYYIDGLADVVTEAAGAAGGFDSIVSNVSAVIAANVELLVLQGAGNINATGLDGQNDLLGGNSGNNVLDGRSGNDNMRGGLGNDTYYVDSTGDITDEAAGGGGTGDYVYASVSFAAALGIERLYLTGAANIDATGAALQNDILVGNAGANIINGLSGNDVMRGGLGNDTYYVDSILDTTDEVTGGGGVADFVYASVSFTAAAGIERLYLQGTGNINATGRAAQNDILVGNSGNNLINGLSGNDLMRGGLGNDTYYVDSISDSTDEVTGGGAGDFVYSAVSFTASQGIERLYLTGSAAINGTGRDAQNDILGGNSGANILSGLTGNDVLIGGLGNDTLTGGAGLDTFRFDSALNASTNMDTVTDFAPVDDTIQLENAIFTALTVAGTLAASAFNTGTAATQADDRIIYNSATGALLYDADGLGGVAGVQFALLSTHPAGVSAADFLVY